MICPYCDSRVSPVPDNRVCPYCGGSLGEQKKLNFPDPPIGVYKDLAGYMEIGKESVTFCRKQFLKSYKRTIPYNELYAVTYQPGKRFDSGFLCVRQWQDRHLPMPTRARDAVWDLTGVYFIEPRNTEYQKVYAFLRQCADIVYRANADWQGNESALYGRYPGFYGYMELEPQALTVYKDIKLQPATKRKIAYDEIAEVAFCEAKGSERGGLSIRQRDDEKRIDRALSYAITDDTSIDFTVSANDRMRQIYLFLSEHADENNRRWMQESSK